MALVRILLALTVGALGGWMAGARTPSASANGTVVAIDSALASIVGHPDQCGTGTAMKAPMTAVAVLKELRVALVEKDLDVPTVRSRLDELGKTNLPPAARAIIDDLAKEAIGNRSRPLWGWRPGAE